jgi:hypothetical protein
MSFDTILPWEYGHLVLLANYLAFCIHLTKPGPSNVWREEFGARNWRIKCSATREVGYNRDIPYAIAWVLAIWERRYTTKSLNVAVFNWYICFNSDLYRRPGIWDELQTWRVTTTSSIYAHVRTFWHHSIKLSDGIVWPEILKTSHIPIGSSVEFSWVRDLLRTFICAYHYTSDRGPW